MKRKEKCNAPLLTKLRSLTSFLANINRGVRGWCADTSSCSTQGSHLQILEGWGDGCLWPFFCNPTHVTRIVVAYWPCSSKVEGLKTVNQQHIRCTQARGLQYNPVDFFDYDLSKQIKEWWKQGKRIVLLMDVNNHPLRNKFYSLLKERNTNMEEFSHKCWGPKEPYTHHSG